jgi:hypothetical protein
VPVDSLPQKPMSARAFALINALPLAVIAIAVWRAPEGYEDETGFHFTKWAVPGSGGASRLLPLILGAIGSVPDLLL